MAEKQAEDAKVFGEATWIYCGSHRRPHLTGWCTVSVDMKVGLGIEAPYYSDDVLKEARAKCIRLGLKLCSR